MDACAPVIFAITSAEVGGAQQSLIRLLEGLDRRVYPPFVLLGEDGPLAARLRDLGVDHEVTPHPFGSARGVKHFTNVVRERGSRVLHLYAPRTLAVAARTLGLAVVERVNLLRGPASGGLVQYPWIDRALLALSHRIIVPSRAMADQLRSRGVPADKIRLIENSVVPPIPVHERARTRAALGIGDDAFVVLSVGRLATIKGPDVLVDAIGRARLPKAPVLVLAGDGPLAESLALSAEARHVDLRLLGNRPDVADLMAACDVYVQPSRSEAGAQAIVEALTAGCAVIATDAGGTAEMIQNGETGFLVPPDDAAALATAIETLAVHDAERQALGVRARAFAASRPSHAAMCRATEAVYQEALTCR